MIEKLPRNLIAPPRGSGGMALFAPEGAGRAGAGNAPDATSAERLAGMSANEAIATLDLPGAADKMPELDGFTFPGPIAEAFFWSDAAVAGIQGPVGSGKTTTLLKSRLRRALAMPRSTIDLWTRDASEATGWRKLSEDEARRAAELRAAGWDIAGIRRYKLTAVRETYRQLWSTTIPSYLEVFPKNWGQWSGGRGDPVTHVIQFDDGHGPVEFRVEFMAFGDTITESMRGIQTTDMWLNEADTVPVDVLTTGIGRVNRWPGFAHFRGYSAEFAGWSQIVCDFNAPDEDNWTFNVFHNPEERARLGEQMTRIVADGMAKLGIEGTARPVTFEFYNQPGYGEAGCENLHNLAPGYYEQQIATNRLAGRGDMTDRLVYNKVGYLRIGEPVFKREFNKRIHVSDEPLAVHPDLPLLIGLDQGLKGAAVIAQFTSPFHWRILAELHRPDDRLMAVTFGKLLADLLAGERFRNCRVEGAWGDMAGEQGSSLAADENETWNRLVGQTANFRVRPQKIGTNRIQPRLEAIRAALEFIHGGEPGLILDPSCKFLRRGFEARYVWTDEITPKGDKHKIPDKSQTEANVMDALQYLLLSQGKPNGLSKFSFPGNGADGRPGGPPRGPGRSTPPGLQTGFDVHNPYGD